MAKKKSKDNELDTDLNFDDLEDLDTDIDFGDLENIDELSREPSKAGIAKEVITEAGKGFLSGLIEQAAKKSLPEEYTSNYYELMDYADFIKETFEENKNKINKSIYRLGKEVKKILPFQFKLLNSYLEKYESEFEEFKRQSEEEIREGLIQSNLASIFDKQLEIQKALEAKRKAEDEVETAERISMSKMNIDILSNIDANISNQTAFTLQISKEYYRKSLELQYKSYFIQADMLKTMREYYKGFTIQLDNIIKNTGLPEFVKLHNTERVSDIIRTQIVQNTYKSLFSNSEYVKNVKKKAARLISDKVSSITDVIDMTADQLSMINSAGEFAGRGTFLASIIPNFLGSVLGEKLANKISPKIKDKIKDNRIINTGANYLSMLGDSPSTLFTILRDKIRRKQEEYADEGTIGRFIGSKLFGALNELLEVTTPDRPKIDITTGSILDHNKPAIFDNKVHRSITEVIPMYLAKILKENTELRQAYQYVNADILKKGPKGVKELVYDYEGRKLVTEDELIRNVEKTVLESRAHKNKLSSTANLIMASSIKELSKDKKANKEALKILRDKKSDELLRDYLQRASKDETIEFNYETLFEGYRSNKKLKDIVESDPKLEKLLEIIKRATIDKKNKKDIEERMTDMKRKYPINAVKKLFSDTSVLAGKKVRNVLKDKQAEVISKAFSKFILNDNKDVSIDNIITGEAFKYIPEKEFEALKDNISILIDEVRKVKDIGDIVRESSLGVLLGSANRSLKDNFELDPAVFQNLADYSPVIFKNLSDLLSEGKRILGVDNLIERKLGASTGEETRYIGPEDIRELARASKDKLNEIREKNLRSALQESLSEKIPILKQNLDNPFAFIRGLIKEVGKLNDSIRSSIKETYGKAVGKIDELKNSLGQLTDDTVDKALNSLIGKIDEITNSIDEIIKKEIDARNKELESLNEAKNKLTEVVANQSDLRDIEKEINRIMKTYDISIKAMSRLKETMISQRNRLVNLKENFPENRIELIKNIRSEIENTLNKVREILEGTENMQAKAAV